jgi:hypothetical protein
MSRKMAAKCQPMTERTNPRHVGRAPPSGALRGQADPTPAALEGAVVIHRTAASPEATPAPRVGAAKMGAAQMGAAQMGASQVGAAQMGAPQVGAAQMGASRPWPALLAAAPDPGALAARHT